MTDTAQSSVLLTIFYNGRKRLKVFFHQGKIIWDNEKPPSVQQTLPIENVISVVHNMIPEMHPLDDPRTDPNRFTIHYAQRGKKGTWKYNSLTLRHPDPIQVSSWVKTLQNNLQNFTNRPKRLLLFINPYGGKRRAMKIYEKHSKPLFTIAGVDVTVNVSQRKDQIRDFVAYHNLDMFDSVACVGGDGTLSELFNGLVLRECRLKQIDKDDMSQTLPKPSMPVGVIPGGSTDTIVYCLHGTTDIQTAVLNIIFGDKLGLDLVSVYDEERLLRLYASVLSYGYLGDVVHHSDRHRWMGPRRYDYSGFKKLMGNKGYEGEIAIYSEDPDNDGLKCYENCRRCTVRKNISETEKIEHNWKTVKGKFFMISGANISCACARSPNGIAPFSHLGDGNVHLVLVQHTSILNNLRLLLRLSGKNDHVTDLPYVKIYKGKEFCFRAVNDKSRWNCDGEVQAQTDIRAKVCCQLLTVFSRGSPQPAVVPKENCCGFCC